MRLPILSIALAASAVFGSSAFGATDPHEVYHLSTLENLRVEFEKTDQIHLEMIGSQTVGNVNKAVHATLDWRISMDPRTGKKSKAEVEIKIFEPTNQGEAIKMRIVGDGVFLHRYDMERREVWSTVYGFYEPKPVSDYSGSDAPKLITNLQSATPGAAAYLVRFLRDLNPVGGDEFARYSTWMPGWKPYYASELGDPTDPIIPTRTYTGIGNQYVLYGVDKADTKKTVAFQSQNMPDPATPDQDRWMPTMLWVAERSPTRVIDLNIIPTAGTMTGSFAPYTGAEGALFRPVAIPRAGGG